jgi:hypothetical protein
MTIIVNLYSLFSKYGVNGIESVQHLILFVVLFNINLLVPENKSVDILNLYNNDITSFKNIILSIKNELNVKLNIFNFDINDIFFDIHDKIITIFKNNSYINFDCFFDDVFKFYLNTENLSISKDYSKYYNNKTLSKWLYNFDKQKIDKNHEIILEGNLKINSIISNINNTDKNYYMNNIFGVQAKNIVSDVNILQIYIKNKVLFTKNITNDDVLINDFKLNKTTFDVIFYDFPQGIHNIIHANCCKKIKNLKIRGTKSEPLLLQLIIGSLNKNGRAYLTVPDSLLFSDSIQHVETRKYLLENLCVNKIIQIDEQFYFNKGIKNSILFFENKNKTTKVDFSKISLYGEEVEETYLNSLDIDKIKNNLYSLYYKNYQTDLSNKSIEYKYVSDLFSFSNDKINNTNYIGLSKYYKNETSIKYVNDLENENFETIIYIDEKINLNIKSNIFMLKYLENNLKNKFEQFTKGKMNQFDIDKIKSFKIPILSEETQLAVYNYLEITDEMIKCNLNKIKMINQMINCLIKTIPTNNMIELSSICEIYEDNKECNLIGIIRNGLTAGTVYKINDISKISNNSYYITIKNNQYLYDFIYHWLLFNEEKLKELSNLTQQSNLNKSNLLSFKIPVINLEKQLDIISYCNDFENQINRYKLNNKAISDKDILSTVFKLNN